MANNLYNLMNGNNVAPFAGNMGQMMQQFAQFRRTFSGDPKAQVQQLLNSGRMTQSQYNQISQMATQFMRMMK